MRVERDGMYEEMVRICDFPVLINNSTTLTYEETSKLHDELDAILWEIDSEKHS